MGYKEDNALILRYRNGDISARNELIENYLSIIRKTAEYCLSRYKNIANFEIDEVVNVGVIKTCELIDKYNIELGVPFASFLGRCLYIEIKREVEHNGLIYTPINMSLETDSVKYLSDVELDETDSVSMFDLPYSLYSYKQIHDFVIADMKRYLSKVELCVCMNYFGFQDGVEKYEHDIATDLQVSTQRVSQILRKSLVKLRHHSKLDIEYLSWFYSLSESELNILKEVELYLQK